MYGRLCSPYKIAVIRYFQQEKSDRTLRCHKQRRRIEAFRHRTSDLYQIRLNRPHLP